MKLDITKVIEKLPTAIKATGIDPVRPRRKKSADAYPTLGDSKRFEKFPEVVDKNFISLYRDDLDAFLIPYIQQGELTVSKAHAFIENLVEQIFGNQKHYGLFSYLKERNYENSAERELVRTAERLINSGWRVQKDKNTQRYKIINSEGTPIIDATGASEFFEETRAATMGEGDAHVFIESVDAAKIEAIAAAVGQDADTLSKINSLDSVLMHTEDKKIHGVVINYGKLRKILKGGNSYASLNSGVSFSDLYGSGFTLSEKMIFSHDERIVLKNGVDDFVVYEVGAALNQNHGANKDLLAVISANFKGKIFSIAPNVVSQQLSEIKDFNRVIALMSNYWGSEKTNLSYADMVDTLKRMDAFVASGEISKDFYSRIFSSFSTIVATEAILLGNNWLSLSNMSLDTISGKFYSYASKDVFTATQEEMDFFYNNYKPTKEIPSFSHFIKSVYPFRLTDGNLSLIIENLPKEYFTALESLELEITGYPLRFAGILNYMRTAVDLLMSRGK